MKSKNKSSSSELDSSLSSPQTKTVASETRAAFNALLAQRSSFFTSQKYATLPETPPPPKPVRKLTAAQKTRLLSDAVVNGDLAAAQEAIDLGADPNNPGAGNITPFARAFICKRPEMVSFLLKHGGIPSSNMWDRGLWRDSAEDCDDRYQTSLVLAQHGHIPPDDLIARMKASMLGKSDLLALADAGKIKLSAEESVFMSFEMIRLAYPKDMIDRAKSGIASGAWQQKTSFSNSRALSKDNLLSSALDSDRVDLFLFLIESGYLEGVAKSGWKTTIDQLKPLSIVAHAAHCGAGRIVQTLARVPSLASHFTSLSQEEKDWILAPSKSASHEVWRGLWEGGVDPFISDSNGQTLLHHVVADKDRVAKIPLIQDLLRRAPGIEESKTNQGETIWEVAEAAVQRLTSTYGSNYNTDQHASLEKLRTTIDESRIRRNISDRRPRKKKSFSRGL